MIAQTFLPFFSNEIQTWEMEDLDQKVDLICMCVSVYVCVSPSWEDIELPMPQQSAIIITFFEEKASLFLDIS